MLKGDEKNRREDERKGEVRKRRGIEKEEGEDVAGVEVRKGKRELKNPPKNGGSVKEKGD